MKKFYIINHGNEVYENALMDGISMNSISRTSNSLESENELKKKAKMECKLISIVLLAIFGILFLVIGIVFPMYFPDIFENMLEKKLKLNPDSPTLEKFKKPPVPIYMQVYFMNVTNEKDIIKNGSKPVLEQIGPYTYYETREKYDLFWNEDHGEMEFKSKKNFYFKPEMSGDLRETDLITTINPIMVTLFSRDIADYFLTMLTLRFDINPFITKRVDELLYKGYEEGVIKEIYKFKPLKKYEEGKTGFFYGKNGTEFDLFDIDTGVNGMATFQGINKWNGVSKLDFWSRDECNMLNGTEGSQFPRPVVKTKPIEFFTAELCRSIYAVYEREVQHGDVTLYRFVLPKELLDRTEENMCYCVDEFTCRPSMINVANCRGGSPVVISTPHFYQGSEKDIDELVGLNPNKDEHETYLDIEPRTGVVFRAAKRIQINMPLRRHDYPYLKNVSEAIIPILWVNESVVVPVETVNQLNRNLTLPPIIVYYGCWTLVALGIILILISIVKFVFYCINRPIDDDIGYPFPKDNINQIPEINSLLSGKPPNQVKSV